MSQVALHSKTLEFLSQKPIPAFIGGRWKICSGGTLDVINPASGSVIAAVSMASKNDAVEAIESAHAAFPAWSGLAVGERAALLHRFANLLTEHQEVLAQLESLDVGKPIVNARGFDVPFGADCFRYFADLSLKAQYGTPLEINGMEARIHRVPYGVCGFIFPWNFPLTLLCWGIAPALAAGNTVVIKVSEMTPLSSLYVARLAEEAGLPAGVINLYTGEGREAGQILAEHPLVKRMSFTGSTAVGKQIGRLCGEHLIPCKLELGGKGAALVLKDADVSAAAQGLASAIILNTGQVCCTATRWYVHEGIFDRFVEQIREILAKTKLGNGMDEETQMGPLVSKIQMERVQGYYDKGLAEGATPVVKLEHPRIQGSENGYFVTPHLLTGSSDNICYREEVFGPTAYLVKFGGEQEAVESINRLSYGLANSVWSADLDRANRIAEKLVSGNSWINAHNVFAYGLPYGGVNLSGTGGGVNSPETFYDYLRPLTVARPL